MRGWTEFNKHMKAKGKNPLAFFYCGTPPLTPLEVDVLLLTRLKGRKKHVELVRCFTRLLGFIFSMAASNGAVNAT